MSTLRTQMTHDMLVRGLAKQTQKSYLRAVTGLASLPIVGLTSFRIATCSATWCISSRSDISPGAPAIPSSTADGSSIT